MDNAPPNSTKTMEALIERLQKTMSDAKAAGVTNFYSPSPELPPPPKVLPYAALSEEELEVVCANCSFPVIEDKDPVTLEVIGHHEEPAPQTMEAALAEGWIDHGLGLFCPKCSLEVLEDLARDRAQEATTGASGDIGEIVDGHVIRSLCPNVSEATVSEFVKMFRSERLSKFRVLAGLDALPIYVPAPKDETQAIEFLNVANALSKGKEKKS